MEGEQKQTAHETEAKGAIFMQVFKTFAAAALLFCASFLLLPSFSASAAPQEPEAKATTAAEPSTPVVTADETVYDADTGRYHLTGNITVTNGDRVTTMDDAQVSATNLEIWGEGSVTLNKGGEAFFTADAVYLEGFAPATTLFGRVRFERPGLVIRAESATCEWSAGTATFHGHVICIESGKETVASTLVYDFESGSVQQYS